MNIKNIFGLNKAARLKPESNQESRYHFLAVPEMSGYERLAYRGLFIMGVFLIALFANWWFQKAHIAHNFSGYWHVFDFILFLLVTYVVWYQIVNEFFMWWVAGFMKKPAWIPPQENLRVAFLTAFVPGKEPYDILEKTLSAMVATRYPHETWLLDEGDETEAKRICQKYGVRHFTRKGSAKYNTPEGPYKIKTKGGNYNAWFDQYGDAYDFVAQLDVDFVPLQDYLIKTLGYFRDPTVAFVGTPQVYGNTNASWIVRGAAEQAYGFYGSVQKGLFGADMTLFIGANHVLRVAAHNDIEGYAGHIVEDHLTGMRLYARQWKSVYVPEILAVGEGPSTWSAYFSQQMRWAYGVTDILFRHSPKIFRSMKKLHTFNYFLLQQYYFYGIAQVIGVALLCLYFFFGIQITPMQLAPLLALYVPLLVFQQIFFLWLQRFNIDPKTEKGLMVKGKMLSWAAWPIYFLAFMGALIKKRLTYVVTPKGTQQDAGINLSLFFPHIVLGTLTLLCVLGAILMNHRAPLLMFWAVLNTLVMYGFFLAETAKKLAYSSFIQPRGFIVRAFVTAMVIISIGLITLASMSLMKGQRIAVESSGKKMFSPLADYQLTNPRTRLVESLPVVVSRLEPSQVPQPVTENHRVLYGESLWSISEKYYGNGSNWRKIQTDDESTIIHPGEIVQIPDPVFLP